MAMKDSALEVTEWYATLKIQVALARHVAMPNDRGRVNPLRACKHHRAIFWNQWLGIPESILFRGLIAARVDIFCSHGKIDLDMICKTI